MNRKLLLFFAMQLFFGANIKINAQEVWTQKDNMPTYRTQGMAFSIGTNGYMVCGFDEEIIGSTDLWEWEQTTETWIQKASLPGSSRASGVAFSIGNKGYVAFGYEFGFYDDFWEWDKATDTWTQKESLPLSARGQAAVFTIGTKAYIVGGFDENYNRLDELWEWDQTTEVWTQKEDLPESLSASGAFSIGTKGYLVSGNKQIGQSSQLWEWDQTMDTWTSKASLPVPRAGGSSFSIGNKGYITTGEGEVYLNDLWEWDQTTDTWTEKDALPASQRARSSSFVIDNKAYVLGGAFGPVGIFNEMWEWDPGTISTTDVKDQIESINSIKIFPNPSKHLFYIQFDQQPDRIDLTITDILGRHIDIEQPNPTNLNTLEAINIEQLPSGIYILNIQTEKGIYTEKLEVQK